MTAPYTSPLAEELAPGLLERFLRYVRVDTQSARGRERSPSTPGQLELARLLVEELLALGWTTPRSTATATSPPRCPPRSRASRRRSACSRTSTPARTRPAVASSRSCTATTTVAVLALPRAGTVLDPAEMPVLAGKVGHDVVTSSGDTLLGADDKAGVAEIMAAVAHLQAHPELPRPTLRVGFTPDEEIGEGATLFDVEAFGASCAYTLDGSQPGELQDETFSGVAITLEIEGVEVHPGWAHGKLVNAAALAGRVIAALPSDRLTPETTRDREGFVHVYEVEGDAGRTVVRLIARDFDDELLASTSQLVRRTAEEVVAAAPGRDAALRGQAAVPEHAPLHRRRARGHRGRRARAARRGPGAGARADPRRDRRLDAERQGPADAEHLHRRSRVPLAARVGVAAGHGRRERGRRAAGSRVGTGDRVEAKPVTAPGWRRCHQSAGMDACKG